MSCGDHVIICGAGKVGSRFVKALESEYQVVIIEKNKNNGFLEDEKDSNSLILYGDATDEDVLEKAGIKRARFIVPSIGSDDGNADIGFHALKLVDGRSSDPLTCYVHVQDEQLRTLMKTRELNTNHKNIRLEFFNFWEQGARMVLNEHFPYPDIQDDQLPNGHILILGLGDMGEKILIGAARKWIRTFKKSGVRLSITVVDKAAKKRMKSLFRHILP